MAVYEIKNENIKIQVNSFGAELKSLKRLADNTEYMWEADPKYWKRTSPILFPFVGSLKNKTYLYAGKAYEMPQHGFARDMEFTLLEQKEEAISFVLESTQETYEKYPFHFRLKIEYQLEGSQVKVLWRVENTDEKEMYFSIGGHPAFRCPITNTEKQTDCKLHFDQEVQLVASEIGEDGLVSGEQSTYQLDKGCLPVTEHLFDKDALVIEKHQAHEVALTDKAGKAYLSVSFDAPLFGIWSPAKKNAPFICIEPWYGRCDRTDFKGSLEEREWGNVLSAGKSFEASYTIKVFSVSY